MFLFFCVSGVGNKDCSYHFSTILGWNQRRWVVHTRFKVQTNSEHNVCPFWISIWLIIIILGEVVPESYSSVLSYFWDIQQLNYTDLHKLKIWYWGCWPTDAMCRQAIHLMKTWRGKLLLSKWWYEYKQTTWIDLELMKPLVKKVIPDPWN